MYFFASPPPVCHFKYDKYCTFDGHSSADAQRREGRVAAANHLKPKLVIAVTKPLY
jgi:hypothetical protein